MAGTVTVLMPNAELEKGASRLAPRLPSLKGKTIGLVDNVIWTSTKMTFQEWEKIFKEEYGAAGVVYADKTSQGAPVAQLKALADKIDAAIVGMGN